MLIQALPDSGSATLRAFAVLDAVVRAEKPPTLAEVMSAVQLPKPTVHRILSLLEGANLLQREPDGKRFGPGPRLAALAIDTLASGFLKAPRHAVLQSLVEEIGETCNVTMLDGSEVVYLDRVETAWPLRMHLNPGSRVPLHCTASGKLFLSQMPRSLRQRLLANSVLKRYTPNTLVEPDALEAELDRCRAENVGTDNEEFLAGMICVAVPVPGPEGRSCAAVAVHAPVARMTIDVALGHLPALRRAAERLADTWRADEEEPRRASGT